MRWNLLARKVASMRYVVRLRYARRWTHVQVCVQRRSQNGQNGVERSHPSRKRQAFAQAGDGIVGVVPTTGQSPDRTSVLTNQTKAARDRPFGEVAVPHSRSF